MSSKLERLIARMEGVQEEDDFEYLSCYLECTVGQANKWWEASVRKLEPDSTIYVLKTSWGPIGSYNNSKEKEFDYYEDAEKEYKRLKRSKERKDYRLVIK